MDQKLFTVQEANQALPRLSRLLTGVRERWRFLSGHQRKPAWSLEEYHIVQESPFSPDYFRALLAMRKALNEVERMGAQVKDIQSGLVDFPSRLYGRDILLCWRLGEDQVRYWHDPEAGFKGRQPLPVADADPGDDEGH